MAELRIVIDEGAKGGRGFRALFLQDGHVVAAMRSTHGTPYHAETEAWRFLNAVKDSWQDAEE